VLGGVGTGATCNPKDEVKPKVEVEATLGVEADAWRNEAGAAPNPLKPKPTGMCLANAFSTSLSYIKLSVVGKKGASPHAILWRWSISNLGSLSVNISWRYRISISKTAS
jgi:hypothetical protein